MNVVEDVGGHIRAARRRRGWSVRRLAAEIGVSVGTVSAIENGRTGLTVARLTAIADALGTDPRVLLADREDHASPAAEPPPAAPAAPAADAPPAAQDWRSFAPLADDRVLRAAIDAFVETGYHGSTMRTIAQRAGLSVPGVYHHYPSKQALLVRIFDLTMDELDWRLTAARDSQSGPLARLAALVEALALFHTLRSDLAFIGASEMRSVEGPHRRRIAARRSAVQRLLDAEIAAAAAAGLARTEQPAETGRAIATMCTSLPQWFRPGGRVSPRAIARAYAELALRMVGAEPVTGSGDGA
jgi:AcrR family transcriptional regulator/DNA-binding XRE family transcriptional regulator